MGNGAAAEPVVGAGSTVVHTTVDGGNRSSSTEQDVALPWQTVEGGMFPGASLIITTGVGGGEVTCGVVVGGEEAETAKASGQSTSAGRSGS